ncbi:neurofilament heavy polypeptide-like isoform X1, partial [Clarias magur]
MLCLKDDARKAKEDKQRGINRAGPSKETDGVVCLHNLTEQENGKKSHRDTRVFVHVTPPRTCRLEVKARILKHFLSFFLFCCKTIQQDGAPSGQDDTACPSVKEERTSYRRSSITSASAKMGNADPEAFIQGMQGYRWTDADLEFVYQAKQQKRAQQLQQELSEVEKTLQAETQRLELAVASRDQLQTELSKTPSCDSLLQLCKSILSHSRTAEELEGLGDRALLSQLSLHEVQRAVRERNAEISRLEREADKARELREKAEKAMKEMGNCQKKISTLQGNIEALKVELAELKTRLSEKEEASKVSRAQAISDTEEKDTEEMKVLEVSQVPGKGHRGSRRAKPPDETLKKKVLKVKTVKEKPSKDIAEDGKKKAPKKPTLKKTTKKEMTSDEMAPNETPSQVKSPDKLPQKVKFSNVAEVLEKGRKGSRTTFLRNKAQRRPSLKDSTSKEVVLVETAEGEVAKKGKTAPKSKAAKKTTSKIYKEEEVTDTEEVPEKEYPKLLEKGRKGSRTINPPTPALKEKTLKKTALRAIGQEKTPQIEEDEKGKTARKVKAPKKIISKNTAEKKTIPQVKTLDEDVVEETAPKVQDQKVVEPDEIDVLLKETVLTVKAPEETAPKAMASKLKATRTRASKKTAELTLNKRASKKDQKETALHELTEDVNSLKETAWQEGLNEASKKETAVENKVKKTTDSEDNTSEKMDLRDWDALVTSTKKSQKKTALKGKALKEMPEKVTILKETVSRRRAAEEKVPKQKAEKNPREDK